MLGSMARYLETIEKIHGALPERLAEIDELLLRLDRQGIEQCTHKLKGMLPYLQASPALVEANNRLLGLAREQHASQDELTAAHSALKREARRAMDAAEGLLSVRTAY